MYAASIRRMVPPIVTRAIRCAQQWHAFITDRLRLGHGVAPVHPPWVHDRGQPVHRYYCEQFLQECAADIHGHCLEFQSGNYVRKYGGTRVMKLDVLHKDPGNPKATLVADLTSRTDIPSELFDCIVCTHVLHVIADLDAFVRELWRLLAPGGVLLVVVPHLSAIYPDQGELWRFTPEGLAVVLAKVCPAERLTICSYGNALTAIGDLRGVVAARFTARELQAHDARFAVEVCARAHKPFSP
jgi:SAM-dependent methyltransferase